MTKLAILGLSRNKEWETIGGRLINCVHDELIAEVPIEYAEEGGRILSETMCHAADFLPFPISCDVTTSFRWYGLEYPIPYPEPKQSDIHKMTEDEIKWVQFHLVESEYILPVITEGDEKPRGDAAKGINGKITDELELALLSYIQKYHISQDEFVSHIQHNVRDGIVFD